MKKKIVAFKENVLLRDIQVCMNFVLLSFKKNSEDESYLELVLDYFEDETALILWAGYEIRCPFFNSNEISEKIKALFNDYAKINNKKININQKAIELINCWNNHCKVILR